MKSASLFSASLLLVFASSVSGFWSSSSEETTEFEPWNSFRVKFLSFTWMPRTEADAIGHGWRQENRHCQSLSQQFVGKRYTNDNIPKIAVLFTNGGRLAGMQIRLPRDQAQSGDMGRAFINDGSYVTVTAYFVDPDDICTESTTAAPDKLVFQLGPYSRGEFITPPLLEEDIDQFLSENNWVEGKCVRYMGKHYWPNIPRDRETCSDTKPFFVMYKQGQLANFGWMFYGDFQSDYFESPGTSAAEMTMNEVPQCLYEDRLNGRMRTMHVYLRTPYNPFFWC